MCSPSFRRPGMHGLLLACILCTSSCYSYRIATHAQPATDAAPVNRVRAYSLFWGLLNKPQVISTPVCDSLGVNGVAEVRVKTNFGNTVLTFCTLGIYCPVTIEWKCAKPCAQVDSL
ncbi:Bor protein [Chitinophaga niastensis]|uniref:Bor protein n=1 Tax=Chitinophaga niastensis TaxID=536980 RepID=A0A2P8HUJ7_CHINA|nr:Bor family protein [Chitinophaga niastensis]PSL49888.1 Bor protein [Chitinophaga niastensis]